MPYVEFVGQSRKDADFHQASTSRLLNLYREPAEDGYVLKAVPGTSTFADLNAVFMRDMQEIDGIIYVACGGKLFSVDSTGTETLLGLILDGTTDLSGNNGDVAFSAAGRYYVWDGAALTQPTGGAFTSVGSVEFVGQTTVMTELNGRRFQWSAVADATSLNGLDFATAEGRDDDIIRAVVINGNLWLFKEKSAEIWYQTATGFSRVAGGVLDTGLKAFGLVTKFANGAFFIGDDDIAYITSGAGMQPVSTPAVESDIAAGAGVNCFYYEAFGHKFCVIQFSDRAAWVYDISTGEWHNRASGEEYGAWPVITSVKAFGHWHVGGNTGQILRLSESNTDHDGPLYRRAVSRTFRPGQLFKVPRLEFFGVMGGPNVSAREPEMMLRMSRDTAKTWGNEHWRSFGASGKYETRAVYRNLGQFRSVTAEITITDATNLPISAKALLETA